jgi:hypothetical protein
LPSTAYCYHCGTHHPIEEMRQIESKTGKRWRCIKSIDAARKAVQEREAFGRQVSENNKAAAKSKARLFLNSNE